MSSTVLIKPFHPLKWQVALSQHFIQLAAFLEMLNVELCQIQKRRFGIE
ncbi:hypothetical protein [Nostoc sp. C057]|nr:hypothetical protein [Nostoc sp. C057]